MIGTFAPGAVVEDSVGPVPQRDGSLGPIATPQARWCTLGGDVVAGAPAVTAAASGNRTKITTTAPVAAGKYRVEFYGTSANGAGVSMEGTACAECEVTASGLVSATVPAGQCADAILPSAIVVDTGTDKFLLVRSGQFNAPYLYATSVSITGLIVDSSDGLNWEIPSVGATNGSILGIYSNGWKVTAPTDAAAALTDVMGTTAGKIPVLQQDSSGEVFVPAGYMGMHGVELFNYTANRYDTAAALAAYGAAKTSDLPAIFAAMGLDPLAVGTVGTVTGLAFTVSGYTGTIPASGTIRLNGQQVSYTFAAGSITLAAGFVGVPSGAWIVASTSGNTSTASISPADIAAIQNGLARPSDLRITIETTVVEGGK